MFYERSPADFLQMKSLKKTGKLKQIVNFELNSVVFSCFLPFVVIRYFKRFSVVKA